MRCKLNGRVTSNESAGIYRWWGYDACCPNDIRKALEECPEDEEIILEVNSGGGSVYAGFEMYSLLRNSGRNITAEVQSLAGSAMSVVVSACQNVVMSPVANIMIHRSSVSYAEGNAEQLEQDAQMLHTMDESILNAYCEKVGDKTSRTTLRHMMENETFLTAQQATDCGLADSLMPASAGQKADPTMAVASIGEISAIIRAAANIPDIEDLKRIKEETERKTSGTAVANKTKTTNTTEECEIMEIKDIQTEEQLVAVFPELTKKIATTAQIAERERIKAIDDIAIAGYESIINEAKADPKTTAGDVAMQIIAEQKKKGTTLLEGMRIDAADSNANAVTGTPAVADALTPEQEAIQAAKADVERRKGGK